MTRKPIVKLVRAVTLKPGDEFYLTAKKPRSVVYRADKTARGTKITFRVCGSTQAGVAEYSRAVMAYKIVGWLMSAASPSMQNLPKGGIVEGSPIMRTVAELEVLSNPLKPRHYAERLEVRQQKEIDSRRKELAATVDSLDGSEQYREQQSKEINELKTLLQETINSLREECALKAGAIAEQAAEIKGLRSKVLVSRSALRTQSELLDDAHTKQDRLQLVVDDITQRLEDFRDGE